jgi:hypothetical protein
MNPRQQLPPSVQDELNDLMLGDMIGEGAFRKVYVLRCAPHLVAKVELSANCEFANVAEWEVWNNLRGTEWEKWLAPCETISFNGSVLIQRRTAPVKRLPKMVPNFMTDLKPENFGRLGGRVVAHDYGLHRLFTRGLRGVRLEPVRT